jgi:hypothetical protein
LGFKKKGFKSSRFKNYGKGYRMKLPTISVYQKNFPSQSGYKPFEKVPGKINNPKKEPLKCCGCREEHRLRIVHTRKKAIGEYIISKRLPSSMMWLGSCHEFM